jgi:hypothetical protein
MLNRGSNKKNEISNPLFYKGSKGNMAPESIEKESLHYLWHGFCCKYEEEIAYPGNLS